MYVQVFTKLFAATKMGGNIGVIHSTKAITGTGSSLDSSVEEGPSWFRCWFCSRLVPVLCCSQQGARMLDHGPMANQGRGEDIMTVDSSGLSRVWMIR